MKTSSSSIYDWNKKSGRKYLYSIFRSIIRAAILNSPVDNFERVDNPKLDFGALSLWQDIFTTEDDLVVEVVEIPKC